MGNANAGMRIALFGGSFDPVHREHVRLVEAAKESLGLDKVIVIPAYSAPHKPSAIASGADRLEMCRIAFRDLPFVEVSDYEMRAGGTSYTYLTCRHFFEEFSSAELFFLVGADMLGNFFDWRNPQEILACVRLAACGRGNGGTEEHAARFLKEFGKTFETVPFCGAEVSSTRVRTELAFGKSPESLDKEVLEFVRKSGLYAYPVIAPALALEKTERQEHSFRVAVLATARARSLGIPEEKALLAAALHDCGKSVPLDSPLLKGFELPEGVPAPVVHQYTGAYLAEHIFKIADAEVLDAIRYHTSGRAGMTTLEKLIYLADLLEEGRTFEGVELLRKLFFSDLNACLRAALLQQVFYLKNSEKTVYSLTEQALNEVLCVS